ncbi:hypothetical protein AB0C29_21605 [Actinoplanes sp. NPDC048791]|uniref:hypothetical protein n=1 Tax=Actinoplanes sp. NPDC048791 TaxID=3154623 RepID=UPI0033ED8890
MASLGAIPALRDLPPAALRAVARRTSPAAFGPGALIRPAGEPAIADKPATLDTGTPPTGLVAVTAVSARLLSRSRFLRFVALTRHGIVVTDRARLDRFSAGP